MIEKVVLDALPLIRQHEGLSLKKYEDTLGLATIGYGTLLPLAIEEMFLIGELDTNHPEEITQHQADLLLRCRADHHWVQACKVYPFARVMPERVQQALVNMSYNLGNRVILFRKMWKALHERDYETAAWEALDSKWANQVPKRANHLASMIQEGEDGQ